jgi:uncharacterized protein YndB with AHSA1/START domain
MMAAPMTEAKKPKNRLQCVLVPNEPVILMTRVFDFPRALVWKAFTSKEHMVHWWGPARYENHMVEWDFRVGGKWKINQTGANKSGDDKVHHFHGDFLEIRAPEFFKWTFGYEDFPAGPETYTFIEENGRTRVEMESVFPSIEARDAIAATDMESGAGEGFDRLDALLEKLSKGA